LHYFCKRAMGAIAPAEAGSLLPRLCPHLSLPETGQRSKFRGQIKGFGFRCSVRRVGRQTAGAHGGLRRLARANLHRDAVSEIRLKRRHFDPVDPTLLAADPQGDDGREIFLPSAVVTALSLLPAMRQPLSLPFACPVWAHA
jgi:hypothetical protein